MKRYKKDGRLSELPIPEDIKTQGEKAVARTIRTKNGLHITMMPRYGGAIIAASFVQTKKYLPTAATKNAVIRWFGKT